MARVQCSLPNTRIATAELALVAIIDAANNSPRDAHEQTHPNGPGWFDSSWELRRGLEVREGLPADANLSEWLTICLGREGLVPHREALPTYRAAPRATASPRSITAIA